MREHKLYEGNRRKRKRQAKRLKIYLLGMFIAIIVLSIYLVASIVTLIDKTVEYTDSNQKGQGYLNGYEQVLQDEDEVYSDGVIDDYVEKTEREILMEKLETFATQNHFSVQAYPDEMIELLEKNPETEEFVLNYPLKKESYSIEPLEEVLNQIQIPLLLQWDSRWGYYIYGNKPMGMTGCGPTCLSMVALHLLQNSQMTPQYVAEFSQQNGFYVEGTGSAWALMTQGAEELGLHAREVSLDEDLVMRYLAQGKPIICAMGRGNFTDNGHFIVFVGTEDGRIRVNDPNSRIRSEELWDFQDIKYQIKNMWVYSVR